MMKFYILLLLSILLIYNNFTSFAQVLKGTIINENNKPIANAHIQLLREGVLRGETITDTNGFYTIYPINKGAYMALIKVEGKNKFIQKIDIKSDTTQTLDFAVNKPRKKKLK